MFLQDYLCPAGFFEDGYDADAVDFGVDGAGAPFGVLPGSMDAKGVSVGCAEEKQLNGGLKGKGEGIQNEFRPAGCVVFL